MSDDIVKNPKRGMTKFPFQHEPEHVRLGKEPIKMERKIVPSILAPKSQPPLQEVSSVDGKVFDEKGNELQFEAGHSIDNNDWVFPPEEKQKTTSDVPDVAHSTPANYIAPILGQPRVGEYILMVFGKITDTGSIQQIESVARAILYGENEGFVNVEVKPEDMIVLKRVGINVGIFIDRE